MLGYSSSSPINVMPGGGGAQRDRVGTLIRNKNLESNFLNPNPWDKVSLQSSPPWEKVLISMLPTRPRILSHLK